MASYRRRYRRYRPRRYIRRWFRRRFRRYVNGSSRSSVRMKTSTDFVFEMQSGASGAPSATSTCIAHPFREATDLFPVDATIKALSGLASPLYRTYCKLYEEVKCIGVKAQINVVSSIGGDIPSVQLFTSWDRRWTANAGLPEGKDLKNASTYNVSTALNNSVAKLSRSCYASDLMEKAQWHDSKILEAATPGDPNKYVWDDVAYNQAVGNTNFFAPGLFLAVATPTLAAATTIKLSVSVVYYYAFRNPKYGAGSSSSMKSVPALPLPVSGGLDDDDGDMGPGGDDLDIEDQAARASADPDPRDIRAPASRSAAKVVDRQAANLDASRAADRRARIVQSRNQPLNQ